MMSGAKRTRYVMNANSRRKLVDAIEVEGSGHWPQ
jgi:hypothetical protein